MPGYQHSHRTDKKQGPQRPPLPPANLDMADKDERKDDDENVGDERGVRRREHGGQVVLADIVISDGPDNVVLLPERPDGVAGKDHGDEERDEATEDDEDEGVVEAVVDGELAVAAVQDAAVEEQDGEFDEICADDVAGSVRMMVLLVVCFTYNSTPINAYCRNSSH